MEHKLNIEGTLHKDPIEVTLHRCNAIYVVITLCSMVVGAFAMALIYHCYELKMISEDQLHIKDVMEMVKRNDNVLMKHYATATNFDKFLWVLKHAVHLEAKNKVYEATTIPNVALHSDEENIRIKEKESKLEPPEFVTGATEHQDDIREFRKAKEQIPENSAPESEVFHWKWTLPSSAWLQLFPFMVEFNVEDASTERSNSAYMNSGKD